MNAPGLAALQTTALHRRTKTPMGRRVPAFRSTLPAMPLPDPHGVARSEALAAELGLADWLQTDDALQWLGGNGQPAGGATSASVYSGHPFGHLEHFIHTACNIAALQALVDAVVEAFYPKAVQAPNRAVAPPEAVGRRTAVMPAHWQAVGFCHGVTNTDNLSILGLTIDCDPFGFVGRFDRFDRFDPGHACNHGDHQGRCAYARQPNVAFWNLHALAQALLPLVGGTEADLARMKAAMEPYKAVFADTLQSLLCVKLGVASAKDDDAELADDLLRLMAQDGCDHTITVRALGAFSTAPEAVDSGMHDWIVDRDAFDAWARRHGDRLQAEASVQAERTVRMARANSKLVLRNHRAETAIQQAQAGDFSDVERLLKVLQSPYEEHPDAPAANAALPPDWAHQLEVSCSS